ncbi:hypothetical protein [Streptomyces sp. NPDC004270]
MQILVAADDAQLLNEVSTLLLHDLALRGLSECPARRVRANLRRTR